ncbi:hypothetical protein ACFLQ8_01225 [Candidatus Auribacterota bacterium]
MSFKRHVSNHRNGGFTFTGILAFNLLVAMAVALIAVMLWQVSQTDEKAVMNAEALSYAQGKMESVQAMPFDKIESTGRRAAGSAFDHYEYEIKVNYADGPVYPDDKADWATKLKNITVIVYHKNKPVTKLVCVRVSRK